jgi:ATP/maltotriose-dependent transcriptional regulator MalT
MLTGEGRSVCSGCSEKASQRTIRRRVTLRQRAQLQDIIIAHERAGDVAREHHVHKLAAQHYEDALQASDADESARMRVSEKLAEVLWLGNEPGTMSPVNDRLLGMYHSHPERSAEHIQTLLRVSQQLWIDSRTQDKVPVLSRAIRLAEHSTHRELLQNANVYMAITFVQIGRFEEAQRYLRAVEQLHKKYDSIIPISYYTQKGLIAGYLGREKEAFASFERAIEIAGKDIDPFREPFLWSDYGLTALMFGRTKLAKSYFERALLIARRNGLGWFISKCCLSYAQLLMDMGEYPTAYEYLLEALSSGAQAHVVDEFLVAIGIPLALQMGDQATLEKCARPHVIERVFLSGQPSRIGNVATAFALLYTERGQRKEAQTLLHRAVEANHTSTTHAGTLAYTRALSLQTARCGAKADFPKARALLEVRVALPGAQVAQAELYLFDAFVAQREGRRTDAHAQARKAAACFDTFGWRKYADLARSLLPRDERHSLVVDVHYTKPFSDTHAKLTEREHEVAGLILKGLTNREMADALSITENTVEKHVAAMMGKLGIRSRYQLSDHLTESVTRKG